MRRLAAAAALLLLVTAGAGAGRPHPTAATGFRRGAALVEIHPGRPMAAYDSALAAIRNLGADWVLLPVYGYMDSAGSAGVDTAWETPVSMADYQALVGRLAAEARQRGLSVLIIPYLNLRHGTDKDWRGNIHPPDWDAWFDSYRKFLDGWVTVCRRERVAMFAVGAELVSTEWETGQWQRTIRHVRSRYRGTVIYSFNWDHYREAAFHRDLDLVGISGYYSLPWDVPLTMEAIESNWRGVRDSLLQFGRETGRPLLFTEIGYPSVTGASRDPWNYTVQGHADPGEQARSISAFIRVWDGTPGLAGVFFWNFSPFRGGPLDTSYSIRGKPAEAVVRNWYVSLQSR